MTQPKQQYGAIYDLISEGPIDGLVNNISSVYYNSTPLANSSQTALYGARAFTGSSSGTSLTSTGFFTSNMVGRFVSVPKAQAVGATNSSVAANSNIITTTTGIFNSNFVVANAGFQYPRYIRISGAGVNGEEYVGRIVRYISSTQVEIFPETSSAISSGAAVYIDFVGSIVNVPNANTATVSASIPRSLSGVTCQLFAQAIPAGQYEANFDDVSVDFRNGSRDQEPTSLSGAPSDSFMVGDGRDIVYNGGNNSYIIDPLSLSGLALTSERAKEISKVTLTLEFPAGLLVSQKDGDIYRGIAEFKVYLKYKKDSGQAEQSALVFGRTNTPNWPGNVTGPDGRWKGSDPGVISPGPTRGSFLKEIVIDLEKYKPFYSWRLELVRETPEDPKDYVGTSNYNSGYNFVGFTKLKTIEAQTNYIFSYPNSAYSLVTFSARDFATPPERSYHIRGKKVKVPTNYITREEIDSQNPNAQEAKYTRNASTGVDSGSYVTWDGSFRGDKSLSPSSPNYAPVYTNNPAWIFYDIITNPVYGLGEFIQDSDIDKYALYQIARYCDELVDDGNGGLEPRFTCNVYFQSKQEAYKVLKDLASAFRGMMYWIDGQITAVQDRPKEPVYTFTQGNVIDGLFSYESTGQRARVNQVNVTWNNPEELYKQSVLTIDDIDNIVETGTVVSRDVVAFGSTSEGQARRVGRWHLLTDTLETEIVKFQTSINAGFLRPGDVINVQDSKLNSVEFSGRVSTGSTSTSIELDRSIVLQAGETYNLYLIYPEPGCYLQQDAATINSVSYSRGDLILKDASNNDIDTSAKAANLVDDSGNKVFTSFSASSRLEKKEISTPAGTVSTLAVSSAFASAPGQDVVWAVSNINEYQRQDSVVRYRVLGITEDAINLYSIVASKFVYEKYDEIEKDYLKFVEPYKPSPSKDAGVPAPTSLKMDIVPTGSSEQDTGGNTQRVIVSWNEPTEEFTDSNGTTTTAKYRFIDSYDIQHNFQGDDFDGGFTTVPVSAARTSFYFEGVAAGNYTIKIRTRNFDGQTSPWTTITQLVKAAQQPAPFLDRLTKITLGGSLNSPVSFESGVVTISNSNYLFVSTLGRRLEVISANSAESTVDFSSISSGDTAYWLFDYSTRASDPWKIVEVHTDSTVENTSGVTTDFSYWKEYGASNNGLALVSGTISMSAGSDLVTGSGTSFTSDFVEGDLIKLSPNGTYTEVAGAEYLEVARIDSDTVLYTKSNATKSFSGDRAYKQSFKIDLLNDNLLAEVSNSGGTFSIEYYVTKSGTDSRTVNLTASDQSLEYSSAGINPDPSSVTITATALNTSQTPYYEFLVGGASVQNSTNSEYYYTAPDNYTSLPQTIEVRLREGASTNSVLARDQITIFGVKPGQSAISAVLSNEAHVLFETESGIIDYVGSGTSIEVFEGNTQLSYDGSASPADGTFKVTAAGTNITESSSVSTVGDARVYGAHSNITDDSATVTYTITATRADGTIETLTRTQSLTKVQEGAAARNVTLAVDDQSISYNTNGASPNPDAINFTATARNMQDTAYYQFFVNNTSVQASSTINTYRYTVPTAFTSLPVQVRVDVREGSASGTVIAQDFVTVIGTKPGENAITIILTNEAHTLPTTHTGAVTYDGSGTDIQVYEGNTQLTVDQSSPYSAGTFRVSGSGSNITVGVESVPNNTTIRYGNHYDMTANTALVTYTIDVVKADGTTATFTRVQSLSKAIQGEEGATGARTASGFLYYQLSSATAPSAPSASGYSYSTGQFSSLTANWDENAPTFAAGNSNKYWYARFTVEEDEFEGTQIVSIGSVLQGIGFTGLVTFTSANAIDDGSGNSLSFGSSGTTTINGGNVRTGSIESTGYVDLSGQYSSVGMRINLDNGSIKAPQFGIDSSGNAYFKGTLNIGGTDITYVPYDSSNPNGYQNNGSTRSGGSIGGWTVDSSAIYSGTKDTSEFTTGGITISSTGGIHTPYFYSESGGAGFRGTVIVGSTPLTEQNTLNDNTTALQVGLGNVANKNEQEQLRGAFAVTTTIGQGYISSGKTAYNSSTAGWYLGYSSTTPVFGIGDGNNYVTWNGSALAVKGTITVGSTPLTEQNTLNDNTTALQVGLGNVENQSPSGQLQRSFALATTITAGNITVGNITIDGQNGRILITD